MRSRIAYVASEPVEVGKDKPVSRVLDKLVVGVIVNQSHHVQGGNNYGDLVNPSVIRPKQSSVSSVGDPSA